MSGLTGALTLTARRAAIALATALTTPFLVVGLAHAEPQPRLTYDQPREIQEGQPFQIEFVGKNEGSDARTGGITISFPGNPEVRVVRSSAPQNTRIYQPGESMYHFGQGRAAPIQSRAVELFVQPWPAGMEQSVRLEIVPRGPISMQARLTLGGAGFVTDPSSGPIDQQGATAALIELAPRTQATATRVPATPAPPTATAAPPTGTPAPPTATSVPASPAAPAPTAAPPPAPSGPAGGQDGISLPLFAGGLAVIGLGIGIGIAALVLLLRQRAPARPAPTWPPPTPYPPGAYPPGYDTAPYPSMPPRPGPRDAPAPTPPASHETAARRNEMPTVQTPYPPPAPTPPPPGQAPPERYQDRTLVGRGGMGTVYRAWDTRLRRWVALKVMHADLSTRPSFVDRFLREAQMAAMLAHPSIVTIHDVDLLDDDIRIVMAWVDGEDLQKTIRREGALPLDRVAHILDQIAAGLDHAHHQPQPVYHRDVKPANIMLAPGDRVVLTDFGIAKLIGDTSLTGTGQVVGSPEYMAPEQVEGAEVDHRSDLYSLGVVLYEMLTGRTPFRADTPLAVLHAQLYTPPPSPRTVTPSLSVSVERVVLKALAKDPSERYQSAGELADAFRGAVGPQDVQSPSPSGRGPG